MERNQESEIQLGSRLLLKLASALNWILKHEISEISFDILLEDFGKILGADHAFIFVANTDSIELNLKMRNLWCSTCKGECNLNSLNFNDFPSIMNKLIDGNPVFMETTLLPKEEQKKLENINIRFIACVPISILGHSSIWGLFGFSSFDTNQQWTSLEYAALKAIGGVMGTIVYKMDEECRTLTTIRVQTAQIKKYREHLDNTIQLTSQKLLKKQSN
jgi:GAF domain-containing protein